MGRIGMEMANRLIWGLFLIAIGALLLAVNLGVELPHGVPDRQALETVDQRQRQAERQGAA